MVVDTGGSNANMAIDFSPCLAKARGNSLSFFKLQTGQFMTVPELFRLQGFHQHEIDKLKFPLSKAKLAGMLGMGFTKTVMQRLLARAIQAAELVV